MLLYYLSLIESEEDKSKFEQLYYKYRGSMVLYATRMMGNETYSEDIVDEAFMRIINHFGGVEDIYSHKTKSFIVTIVKNICKDYLKAQKRVDQIPYDEEKDLYYRPYKKIQYNLEEIELSALVDKLKELPPIYYEVIKLKYYMGYNSKEIADMLKIAYPTVRKRLERGKQLLGSSLQEWRE